MHNYESTFELFPEGASILNWGPAIPVTDMNQSAFATTLPYIEQESLQKLIDFNVRWEVQLPAVAQTRVVTYICPSNGGKEVITDVELGTAIAAFGGTVGNRFAVCSYVLSKGPNFRWCNDPGSIRDRGMFDIGLKTGFQNITDGSSNTLCLGEGAVGLNWRVSEGMGSTGPAAVDAAGGVVTAFQSWFIPQTNSTTIKAILPARTSIFASTFDPMNKNPITETVIDDAGFNGTAGGIAADGDATSNFRSDHPGGSNFAMGDGSTRFLRENINQTVFNGLGTIQGGEVVSVID